MHEQHLAIPAGRETIPGLIADLLKMADDPAVMAHRRAGPYRVVEQTEYWTLNEIRKALRDNGGTLTEETLPDSQTCAVVTDDEYGLAQVLIPVDEQDADSAADLAAILGALNDDAVLASCLADALALLRNETWGSRALMPEVTPLARKVREALRTRGFQLGVWAEG